MKYTGKLYGKIAGRTFELGKTAKHFDDLVDALQGFVTAYEDYEFVLNDEMRATLNKAQEAIKKATS
jgi:hypothetical protein